MGAVAAVIIRKCRLPQVAETAVEFTANGLFMGGVHKRTQVSWPPSRAFPYLVPSLSPSKCWLCHLCAWPGLR